MKLHPIRTTQDIRLDDEDARADPSRADEVKEHSKDDDVKRISKRQRLLHADGRHALLIVLQGRDASGKDGTIRKVFSAINPQGCSVASFGAPTALEQRHDFLWRIHAQIPPLGMIGVFNRSHYEDILVPRVNGTLDKEGLTERCEQINEFERFLTKSGVTILKFMLHVSRDEQRNRLQERLTDETKRWKFRLGDLDDRARWDDFTKAYRNILKRTSTKHAPWYIVPADDEDVRDWLVSKTIADTLEDMELQYPEADASLDGLTVE